MSASIDTELATQRDYGLGAASRSNTSAIVISHKTDAVIQTVIFQAQSCFKIYNINMQRIPESLIRNIMDTAELSACTGLVFAVTLINKMVNKFGDTPFQRSS